MKKNRRHKKNNAVANSHKVCMYSSTFNYQPICKYLCIKDCTNQSISLLSCIICQCHNLIFLYNFELPKQVSCKSDSGGNFAFLSRKQIFWLSDHRTSYATKSQQTKTPSNLQPCLCGHDN